MRGTSHKRLAVSVSCKRKKGTILNESIFIGLYLLVGFVYLLALIFVLLVSFIYFIGFLYDAVMGNVALNIGSWVAQKIPQIKNNRLLIDIWKIIQPKEIYLRYETPLFTYCFSYTAISIISIMMPGQRGMQLIYASIIYLLCYFVGMRRKCGRIEEYYVRVLKNNKDFLKLSFLPITFIITVVGFYCTITGLKIQEITLDFPGIQDAVKQFWNYNDYTNIVLMFIEPLVLGIVLLVLFYIVSLPIQVMSYFIISVIQYFCEYREIYINILKNTYYILKKFFLNKK